MRRLFAPVLAAFVTLLTPVAAAQITATQFEEAYGAEQPVSGRGFVGAVLAADAAGSVAIEKLEVFIPPGTAGDIKVSLISADAKYRGTITAPVGSGAKGWTSLKLPKSKYQSVLQGYSTDSLTLFAEAGDTPLLTRWGTAAKTVQVYVNSERSDTSIAWRKDGKIEVQPCRRLTGGALVRFDTICSAPSDILGPEPIRIIRRRGGVALEPVLVPLAAIP